MICFELSAMDERFIASLTDFLKIEFVGSSGVKPRRFSSTGPLMGPFELCARLPSLLWFAKEMRSTI